MQSSFLGSTRPLAVSRAPVVQQPVRIFTAVENRVALRFQRFGRKKLPFYRLVAIDSKTRRDGKPLEYLGWYDPMKKASKLNSTSIKKWLGFGAQPSDTVRNLLKKASIIEAPSRKQAASKKPDAPKSDNEGIQPDPVTDSVLELEALKLDQ